MRIVLADLKGGDGFVSKDTVAGGYGSRLRPFSKVTRVVARVKRRFHDLPSVHLAYAGGAGGARRARGGRLHAANWSMATWRSCCRRWSITGAKPRGRDAMRARGVRVGFIGLAAQKLPQLFEPMPTSSSRASPRRRSMRLVAGETLRGHRASPADRRPRCAAVSAMGAADRRSGGACACRSPAGRSAARCRCSRRAAARSSAPIARTGSRRPIASRSVANILDELAYLAGHARAAAHRLSRSAVLAGSRSGARAVRRHPQPRPAHTFECETRLDRLDDELLDDDARGRAAGDELRRRVAGAGDAEEGRPAADSRGAPAGDAAPVPRSSASSPRRSTCSASARTRGSRSARRSTTPSNSVRRSRSSRS